MTLTPQWTVTLKNGIYGGLRPVIDPFNSNLFYIADGAGSAFPSMKLRQLSLTNGEELHAAPIKNTVRCLYFNPDQQTMFAVSDSKIFQLDRGNLTIVKKHEKSIAKYCDYIASNDKDTLLLMNHRRESLFIYNYLEEKGSRKKLSETCIGIEKDTTNNFLIFSPKAGTVVSYNLSTNKATEVLKSEAYYNAHRAPSGAFYLQPGRIEPAIDGASERILPGNTITLHSTANRGATSKIVLDFEFDRFFVSDDEQTIYLIDDNQFWSYSVVQQQITLHETLPEKARIAQVFPNQKKLLSYPYDAPDQLTCWQF